MAFLLVKNVLVNVGKKLTDSSNFQAAELSRAKETSGAKAIALFTFAYFLIGTFLLLGIFLEAHTSSKL